MYLPECEARITWHRIASTFVTLSFLGVVLSLSVCLEEREWQWAILDWRCLLLPSQQKTTHSISHLEVLSAAQV
jgi:hypothetical protein